MSIGNLELSEMGIENNLNRENLINFLIYSCFIVIIPLLMINIFTAISMDEIQKVLNDSKYEVALNRIDFIIRSNNITRLFKTKRLLKKIRLFKIKFFSNSIFTKPLKRIFGSNNIDWDDEESLTSVNVVEDNNKLIQKPIKIKLTLNYN